MSTIRSALYVPGVHPEWFEKASAVQPDVVIVDLEDSVPAEKKAEARSAAVDWLMETQGGSATRRAIRVNAMSTISVQELYRDLAAIIPSGPDFLILPKISTPDQLHDVSTLVKYLEYHAGVGRIGLVPILESALAVVNAGPIAKASDRVSAAIVGGGRGGDTNRSIGYEWSAGGWETHPLRGYAILHLRAAGVDQVLGSGWMELDDVEGLQRHLDQNRALGYSGEVVIHPSHVPVANALFGPSKEDIRHAREILKAYEDAQAAGHGTARFRGAMIDEAMASTARDQLTTWKQDRARGLSD